MEPSNLNPTPPSSEDDVLDTMLLRSAPSALADDGFSARVLAALPAASTETRPLRLALVALAGLAGTALAIAVIAAAGGVGTLSRAAVEQFRTITPDIGSASADPLSTLGLAAFAVVISLFYAFRPRLGRRHASAF